MLRPCRLLLHLNLTPLHRLSSFLVESSINRLIVLLASGVLGLLLQLGDIVCGHLVTTFASVCLDL